MRKAQWANAVKRDELQHLKTLQVKKDLDVSREQLWAEMEYPSDLIEELSRAMLRRAALATKQLVNKQSNGNQTEPIQDDDDA